MESTSTAAGAGVDRRFYTLAGVAAVCIIALGFAKTYYLKTLFGTPALPPLLHLHGAVMSSWFLLFIVQARLVASHRVDLHRKLGILGGVLAAAVLMVGITTAVAAARQGHTPGPPPLIFLVVPLFDMLVFASLVGAGLWYRNRPDVHKRLMLLSCLGILAAAIARVPFDWVAKAGPLAYFGLTDLFVFACVAYDWRKGGRLHPAFGWGSFFILLSHPLRLVLGGTSLWMTFAKWVTG